MGDAAELRIALLNKPKGRAQEGAEHSPRWEAVLLTVILALSLATGLLYARLLPPWELWKKVATSNRLERDFREARRRSRPMGLFPNEESAQRIFCRVTNSFYRNGHHPLPTRSAESLT